MAAEIPRAVASSTSSPPQPKGKWKYTVLYTFSGGSDGCIPAGNLVFDKKGNLYGGTVLGGTTGNGVIFELTP